MIVCLVRAETEQGARVRLERNMQRYKLWAQGVTVGAYNVEVVCGDVSRPRLGLTEVCLCCCALCVSAHRRTLIIFQLP